MNRGLSDPSPGNNLPWETLPGGVGLREGGGEDGVREGGGWG